MTQVEKFDIKSILKNYRTIAVVGLSPKPYRPSYQVASYLKSNGYKIIPVNPLYPEILGEKSYPDLQSILQPVDIVDIFRKSEEVLPIVEQAVQIKAYVVWMQEGVINHRAADLAKNNGLQVVMNRCLMKEHLVYFGD